MTGRAAAYWGLSNQGCVGLTSYIIGFWVFEATNACQLLIGQPVRGMTGSVSSSQLQPLLLPSFPMLPVWESPQAVFPPPNFSPSSFLPFLCSLFGSHHRQSFLLPTSAPPPSFTSYVPCLQAVPHPLK